MRRAFALAAAIGIAAVAAACGRSDAGTPGPANGGAKDGKTKAFTITVSYWEDRKAWETAVERRFKAEYPNGSIEWRKYDGDKYVKGLLTAQLVAGQAADVIVNQSPAAFGKAGYVADLTAFPYAAAEYGRLKRQDEFEGKIYGVPLEAVTNGVFYNKRIFAELGIGVPQSWDEFVAACVKIRDAGIAPIVIGARDSWTATIVGVTIAHSFVYSLDSGYDKAVYDGRKKLNGPELAAGMKRVEQLAAGGFFNKDAFSIGYDQAIRQFADGKAAMVINGNWFLGDVSADGPPSFEIGYFPIRDEQGRATLVTAGDKKVSVNARSEHLKEAEELVSIMFAPDILPIYLREANAFSPIEGISSAYDQPAMKEIERLQAALPSGQQIGASWPGAVNAAFADMIAQTIADRKWNPADLAEMQKLYEEDKHLLFNIPR